MTTPDFEIDLCGESCPYPVIHTLEALHGLKPGQTLEVTTDCPQAYRNVPDDATAAGHELIGEPTREGRAHDVCVPTRREDPRHAPHRGKVRVGITPV
ncbi:sulfurtransferase-like selenium metabolism protein YedF [Corynebacterium striatum]|uniref:sulfurtransferase-like selenium metabolism protein YedF n=1 Tax=Corynebacterium striatum TaxID=43770 RepID=UPI000D7740BA|nr:sulfurtransferase-like selenium metabolism protein YedF [Corynebacterium striatum]PXY04825.1 hypothetical protein CKF53_08825 [Corynebacterium striatum]